MNAMHRMILKFLPQPREGSTISKEEDKEDLEDDEWNEKELEDDEFDDEEW